MRKLKRFEIRHVLRHLNKDADRLANAAMDRGMGRGRAAPGEMKRSETLRGDTLRGKTLPGDTPRGDALRKDAAQAGTAPAASTFPSGADAFATPPVVSPPAPREEARELRGFVRDGVVEFTGEKFPDGVFVLVRRAR